MAGVHHSLDLEPPRGMLSAVLRNKRLDGTNPTVCGICTFTMQLRIQGWDSACNCRLGWLSCETACHGNKLALGHVPYLG
jgi:hypothetical protein